MSLRPTTLIAVLEDLFRSLYRHGLRRVLIVNGHGGNAAALSSAIHLVADDLRDMRFKTLGEQVGSHASPGETAFMLAVRPSAVKLHRLTGRDAPVQPSREATTLNTFAEKYPYGIMGRDPRRATRQAGAALLNKSIEICARELTDWI